MQRDENEFRIRIGRSASDVRPALKQVLAGVRRASASTPKGSSPVGQSSVRAHFAKGSASSARPVRTTQRRVVVKARFVAHVAGRAKTLRAHVAYLGREGAARPNQPEVSDQREPSREMHPVPVHLLDVRAAAAWLGLSKSTLDKMRCYGVGPQFIRATGRAVRYDPADLAAFAAARRQSRTTDEVPA